MGKLHAPAALPSGKELRHPLDGPQNRAGVQASQGKSHNDGRLGRPSERDRTIPYPARNRTPAVQWQALSVSSVYQSSATTPCSWLISTTKRELSYCPTESRRAFASLAARFMRSTLSLWRWLLRREEEKDGRPFVVRTCGHSQGLYIPRIDQSRQITPVLLEPRFAMSFHSRNVRPAYIMCIIGRRCFHARRVWNCEKGMTWVIERGRI
jgi:hypothetical protein